MRYYALSAERPSTHITALWFIAPMIVKSGLALKGKHSAGRWRAGEYASFVGLALWLNGETLSIAARLVGRRPTGEALQINIVSALRIGTAVTLGIAPPA